MDPVVHAFRLNLNWYLGLNWERWHHSRLQGHVRRYRRNDVIMSAMFKAKYCKVHVSELCRIIGIPEWLEGTLVNGCSFYEMRTNPAFAAEKTYMCFSVWNGIIESGGTNKMLQFRLHCGRRLTNH